MDWGTIKETIRVQVRDVLGLPDTDVYWAGSVRDANWHGVADCRLKLKRLASLGQDELRWEFDAGPDVIVESIHGNRTFRVELRLTAQTQEDGESETLNSNFRTRFGRPSVRAALRAEEVAFVDIESSINQDYLDHDRSMSLFVTELVFSAGETDEDTTATGDYIERVGVKSETLNDPGGTPISPQLDFEVPEEP